MDPQLIRAISKLKSEIFLDVINQALEKNQLSRAEFLELVKYRAFHDFRFFSEYFFSHYCTSRFSQMHLDFFVSEFEPLKKGFWEVIAAPRGHAKTTFKLTIKTIHAIVYGYDQYIVLITSNVAEAESRIQKLRHELENNKELIEVFGALAPIKGQNQGVAQYGGSDQFITQNNIKVQAFSRLQPVRGISHGPHRPSRVILDDVETSEGVYSPEQREKTRDWFFKDVLKIGRTDGTTNFTVIGTCLHIDSLLSELLRTPGWTPSFYQAVITFSNFPKLWEAWKTILANLSNPQREQRAKAFLNEHRKQMYSGVKTLWPQQEPFEALMRMQVTSGMASFLSEKQNEPRDPDKQIIDMSKAKRFRSIFENGKLKALEWLDGSGKIVPASHLRRIVAFLDPAQCKSKTSHFAAIVVCAKDRDGYFYCLEAFIDRVPPSRQVEKVFELHHKWNLETFYFEDNNGQAYLESDFMAYQHNPGVKRLRVVGVRQEQYKYARIATLETVITNGHLLFASDLDKQMERQLNLFPTDYDDGPDALQGGVARLREDTSCPEMYESFYGLG